MAYRYKTRKINGKTKLAHRHVAEEKLGRPLLSSEDVHHRNEDQHDNSPDNLEVLPGAAHRALHADQRLVHPRTKACAACGATFTPHRTKRKRAKACSPKCANTLRSETEKQTKAAKKGALVSANYTELEVTYRGVPEFALTAAE